MESSSYRVMAASSFPLGYKFRSSLLAKPCLNSAMLSFTYSTLLSQLTPPTSLDQSAEQSPANAAVFSEHFSVAMLT